MTNQNVGTIVTVIGAVLDIKFHPDHLPNLLNAIEIDNNGQKLVVEVAQHIGDDIVRCIAMGSTDGLVRGMEAVDTGASIKVPVGKETLGRIFNLLGEAVDNKPQPVSFPISSAPAARAFAPTPCLRSLKGRYAARARSV